MMKKINKISENIGNNNLEKLRKVFPQFVKDRQIDFNSLKTFFDENEVLAENEKYGLSWAGKGNAFRNLRVPATGTLSPDEKESKNWDKTENLFIEGDNLEVLKLLQKYYREKIKMIYIDPPYNTGKDFIYKDNFTENKVDYYERTGQTENGIKMTTNPESSGRYHSDWLTMMYPRLFLARNLLKEDGVIFISIDDNEVANLRLIMDEIFGEENFVAQLIWRKKKAYGRGDKYIIPQTEYILIYHKTELLKEFGIPVESEKILKRYKYKDKKGKYELLPLWHKSPTGLYIRPTLQYKLILDGKNIDSVSGQFLWKKDRITKEYKKGFVKIIKFNNKYRVYSKSYLDFDAEGNERTTTPISYYDMATTSDSAKELNELFKNKIFDFSKPVKLIKHLLKNISYFKGDIILDFFAGSGTTAHAVMDLNAEDGGNRKWICVQLPEIVDEKSEAKKAGFENIAQISRERIRRAGEKIGKGDVGFKALKLQNSNYRQWEVLENEEDKQKLLDQSKLFVEKPLTNKYDEKSVVYEILTKEGFDLNSSVILNEKVKSFAFWEVKDGEKKMFITFTNKITQENVEKLNLTEKDIFVCFDSSLDDSTKVNLSRNVDIRVI